MKNVVRGKNLWNCLVFFIGLVCHTVNTAKIKCGEEAQKKTVGAYKIAPNFHQATQSP